VIAGHVLGILIPESWTSAIGITEGAYHVIALAGGLPAGLAMTAGLAILLYRRGPWRRCGSRRSAATS
jgi:nitrate reductase gamma subunit